jgi:hypothetical protein
MFQMRDATGCQANADARWLEYTKGKAINFTGDVSEVFGCLASNVGVKGCGYEHQLGVFEWAFEAKENLSQWDFLRPEAYLGSGTKSRNPYLPAMASARPIAGRSSAATPTEATPKRPPPNAARAKARPQARWSTWSASPTPTSPREPKSSCNA